MNVPSVEHPAIAHSESHGPHPESPEHFSHHVRRYLYVFYALLFGTIVTVLASYIPFGHHAINIGVALFIATGKAFLVAGYFMHLVSKKKVIDGIF